MFRTFLVTLTALLVTLIAAPTDTVLALTVPRSPWIERIIRWWARSIVRAAGIHLTVENSDRIAPSERYIFIANHNSYLDIPCLLAAGLPQPLRFMAKVSLFKIPIFGWGIAATGFIPVDRKNRSTAVRSFELAGERIRKGNSIIIFPEEGRSSTREMKPFQRGAFLLALKAKLPIIPLALVGTYDVLPVGASAIKPGRVTIRVGHPIETSEMTVRQKEDLMTRTREAIEAMQHQT